VSIDGPMPLLLAGLIFLFWGSFLNVLGYRLISLDGIFRKYFFCPKCDAKLSFKEIIPVISWLILKGRCSHCTRTISALYPFIEIFTSVVLLTLLKLHPDYFWPYFIFFSALIITIRSDFETMLISRFATLWLVPLGLIFSYFQIIPLTFLDSVLGALVGYAFPLIIAKTFLLIRKEEGMGEGDMDLLSFIGSFTGSIGAIMGLFGASFLGLFYIIFYGLIYKHIPRKFPFGPFIAIAAILFVLFETQIWTIINSI